MKSLRLVAVFDEEGVKFKEEHKSLSSIELIGLYEVVKEQNKNKLVSSFLLNIYFPTERTFVINQKRFLKGNGFSIKELMNSLKEEEIKNVRKIIGIKNE